MEPLWKGQECLIKIAKFGPFPCTILYKSCSFYPSWQATSFERPSSGVAFIEGFHCNTNVGNAPHIYSTHNKRHLIFFPRIQWKSDRIHKHKHQTKHTVNLKHVSISIWIDFLERNPLLWKIQPDILLLALIIFSIAYPIICSSVRNSRVSNGWESEEIYNIIILWPPTKRYIEKNSVERELFFLFGIQCIFLKI